MIGDESSEDIHRFGMISAFLQRSPSEPKRVVGDLRSRAESIRIEQGCRAGEIPVVELDLRVQKSGKEPGASPCKSGLDIQKVRLGWSSSVTSSLSKIRENLFFSWLRGATDRENYEAE
jgi:hypothetical protein